VCAVAVAATRDVSCLEVVAVDGSVVARENMLLALKRVESNKGAAGVDGMPVRPCGATCASIGRRSGRRCWQASTSRRRAAGGDPKPAAEGCDSLGIPTVLDRLIQQALHQVLQPIFEPQFSEHKLRVSSRSQRAASGGAGTGLRRRQAGAGVVDIDLEQLLRPASITTC